MKTESSRNTVKTPTQRRTAKVQTAKAGIKMRSGLRAGFSGGWTNKY